MHNLVGIGKKANRQPIETNGGFFNPPKYDPILKEFCNPA